MLSNVSSNCLPWRMNCQSDYICLTFLHCVFSNVPGGQLPSGAKVDRKMSVEMRRLLQLRRCVSVSHLLANCTFVPPIRAIKPGAVLKSLTRASQVGTGRARAAQRATTCCSFANFLLTLITLDNVKCDDLMLLAFDGSKTHGIIVSCSSRPSFDF